jgi:hypothetical protein
MEDTGATARKPKKTGAVPAYIKFLLDKPAAWGYTVKVDSY